MKKFISLFLILLMLITLIAACGDGGETKGSHDTNTTAAKNEIIEEGSVRPPLNVPVKDYDGYEFRILSINTAVTGNTASLGSYYNSDFIYIPERAGEPINDAVYDRNLKIKEEFNVDIINKEVADVYAEARKIIISGEDAYDIVMPYIDPSFTLAQEKYIYNLYTVPHLDLSNPWWDQALVKGLSLNNKLYTITGDISMQDEELNWAICVNKTLMEQYEVPDLYQIVRAGKWTLDTMYNIGKSVTYDLNGDGILNWEDVYAYGNDASGNQFFYFAAGENIAVLDKDGYPKLTVGGERAISVMDKITNIFNDTNFMIWASKITTSAGGWSELRVMFRENRLMIFSLSMYAVKEFRGMVDDFGILPGPKYDEKQEDYHMIMSTHACISVCIPITNNNLERTGILLEAISYYSQPIQEAYYDITLTGKFTRDEESREMLDLIFGNVVYDIGKAFGWGGFIAQMLTATQKNTGFAALVEANRTKAETEIEKSFEIFMEIDT